MIRTCKPKRGAFLSRSALGLALAFGVVAGGLATAEPAFAQRQKAPSIKLSPNFQKAAAPLSQAIEAAKTRADVVAAKNNPQALATALAAEKGQLDGAFAAATTPDDKFTAGQLAVALGGVAQDQTIQRRGLVAMIESGKAAPADLPRLNFFVGQLSYALKDYAAARPALQAALDGGYKDGDADILIAESYLSEKNFAQGLTSLKQAIDTRRAAGQTPPASWFRRGLGAAYSARMQDRAAEFAMALVDAYPTKDNWAGAITVVREVGKFPAQETLDLMRLMGRTNSYAEERDYIEYLQAADARRLPGEVQKVLEQGVSTGKLRAADPFVVEARTIAGQRLAADRASLGPLERDARAANATGATVAGAGDAFLSYGEAAKAEEFYKIALGKPGVDSDRVLTRLGIAQADLGKFADAQASFNKVGGVRKPIAQLWAIHARQKAAPAAATPAS